MTQILRRFRLLAVALPLIGMVSNGEEQQSESKRPTTHSAHRQAERRTMAGIGKFGEVTPLLYRGAQPDYKGFKALAESGVQIVVDTRGHREKSEGKEVKMLGMKYVAIPWHCPFPPDDTFAKFLKLIKENPKKKIFVHCRLGDDRTGMMIAAYRMADEGWTADEAMREMQKFGFNRAHHFICPRLASYEKSFPERLKHNSAFKGLR